LNRPKPLQGKREKIVSTLAYQAIRGERCEKPSVVGGARGGERVAAKKGQASIFSYSCLSRVQEEPFIVEKTLTGKKKE